MLTAGTKPEVAAGNDKIPLFYPGDKGGVGIFHSMLSQLRKITPQVSKPAWYNLVG
jgi:hypothetical protein